MRAAIRTLVALTLMAWGQFGFAAVYQWYFGTKYSVLYPTVTAACNSDAASIKTLDGIEVVNASSGAYNCRWKRISDGYIYRSSIGRVGDSCPQGSTYNLALGQCDGPKDCSSTIGKEIIRTQICQYNKNTKLVDCDDQISDDGCKYTGGKKYCVSIIDQQSYQCTATFYGSGESNGAAPDTCTGDDCSKPVANDPESNCVTANGVTTCITDNEQGCGTINGVEGCFQEEPGCGYFNGTYQCIGADKPSRNCGYFNGKQTCFDPSDPTKVISEASSDHPANGGNADGDDTNDPRPSNGTGTSSQGSGSGATNQSIEELGEKLGPKIDKTNSLLTDIRGSFEELNEGLFGGEFSESDLGEEAGAGEAGEQAGDGLGEALEGKAEEIQADRDAEAQAFLEGLPDTVGDWFGINGERVGLDGVIDGVLPTSMGCADYRIEFSVQNPINNKPYSIRLDLPVCELTRIKPLLEWVIWVVTVVGLWKILYSALRQEDVKASKGGF